MRLQRLSNLGLLVAAVKHKLNMQLTESEYAYLSLYATEFANIFSRGRLVPVSDLSSDEIQLSFNFIGTRETKHKVFCVTNINKDFEGNITKDLKELIGGLDPSIKVVTQISVLPFKYDINGKNFRRQYASSLSNFNRLKKLFDSFSDEEKIKGKYIGNTYITEFTVEGKRFDYESHKYVLEASAHGKFGLGYIFVHLYIDETKRDKDDEDKKKELSCEKALYEYFETRNCKLEEVRGLRKFIEGFSPLNIPNAKEKIPNVCAVLLPHEKFIEHFDDSQGIEGERGIRYGMLANNATPLAINHKESPTASITTIVGKTGSGKSDLMKGAVEEHILQDDYLDICDYKGTEYTPLKLMYPSHVHIINMDLGMYVNTLDLSTIPMANEETRHECIEFTVNILMAALELSPKAYEKSGKDIETLLLKLITTYMNGMGITNNPDSFYKSKGASYLKFWSIAKNLLKTSHTMRDEFEEVIPTVTKGFDDYFDFEGTKKHYFRVAINIGDIINSKVVIYSLNQLNKKGMDLKTRLSYMYMTYLSRVRNMVIKSQKNFQVLIFEEVQEGKKDIPFLKNLARECTLSRSANKTLYILLNDANIFNKTGNEEIDEAMSAVKASITNYFIGYVEEENLSTLKHEFRLNKIYNYIELIVDTKTRESYRHHFAFQYDTGKRSGYGMMCQQAPEKYRDNPLYITRDHEKN